MKKDIPFYNLFNAISPKDFVHIFNNEYPQTIAFLLSFCHKKRYIKKVTKILEKGKQKQDNDEKRYSCIIQEYLLNYNDEKVDKKFLTEVEVEVTRMMSEFMSIENRRKFI